MSGGESNKKQTSPEYAMDDADIFHKAMAGYGGRLDPMNLHPSTAEGLNQAADRARGFLQTAAAALPNLPPIYFGYFNNSEFNAVAFREDGRYFIGVSRGAAAILAVLFDRMLADPRILPIWNRDPPEVDAADLPLIPDLGPDFLHAVASVPLFSGPRHPARQAAAGLMKAAAFDFLIAHEFAHIANGHIDYLNSVRGVSAIDEVGDTPESSETALIRQTMEMDADGTAVWISLGSDWRKVAMAREEYYRYPGIVSLIWSYAVSSLCRVFGDNRLTGGDVMQESYPRWRLRSVMIQQETGRVPRPDRLQTNPALVGDEHHRIPAAIKAAHEDVERIFSLLTGKPESMEGLDEAWGDVGKSQKRRLQEYWRTELRGELLRFAYHPLNCYGESGGEATGEPANLIL